MSIRSLGGSLPSKNRCSGRKLWFEYLEGRRVLAENLAPVNSVPIGQSFTPEDPTVVFGAANQISTIDVDAGSQPLRMTLFVNSGTLTLGSTTGLNFIGGGNGTRYLLFDGNQSDINHALFGLTYRTNSGVASDVLTVDTHDLGHTGTGGAKVDRDTISLTRGGSSSSPNQAPINQVPPSQAFTAENPTVTFGLVNRISTSDPDVGSEQMRMTLFVGNGTLTLGSTAGISFRGGANGTRYLLFDGTQTDINNALLNLTYTANANTTSDLLTIDTHDLGHTGTGGARVDRDSVSLFRTTSFPNQSPVNTVTPGRFFTDSNPTVTFGSLNPIRTFDPDAGDLALRVTLFVNGGTLTLGTTNGLTFLNGANGTRYLLFDGSQTDINNALFNLTYRANAGTNSDVLTFDTHDLGHTGSGGARVDRSTVTLTRVSGSGFGVAGIGSGESASEGMRSSEPPTESAPGADAVFTSPVLPLASPPASESAVRLADLLASTNSGRARTARSTDQIFSDA
jgi:large repetitive protein